MSTSVVSSTQTSELDIQALSLLMALRNNLGTDSELSHLFDRTIANQMTTGTTNLPPSKSFKDYGEVVCLTIDTSGKDGEIGLAGVAAQALGAEGMCGANGEDGRPARDINLQLKKMGDFAEVEWEDGKALLKLSESSSRIAIRAIGGKGGTGGLGGRGGNGIRGRKGHDATRYSRGENGQDGGGGGAGGVGGAGGCGGRGGHLVITVSDEDRALLKMVAKPDLSGGDPGEGGHGGVGGAGGYGGAGGDSHQWIETTTSQQWVLGADGRSRPQTHLTAITRSNPGGLDGYTGVSGRHGITGQRGAHGADGDVEIRVGECIYNSLQNLSWTT